MISAITGGQDQQVEVGVFVDCHVDRVAMTGQLTVASLRHSTPHLILWQRRKTPRIRVGRDAGVSAKIDARADCAWKLGLGWRDSAALCNAVPNLRYKKPVCCPPKGGFGAAYSKRVATLYATYASMQVEYNAVFSSVGTGETVSPVPATTDNVLLQEKIAAARWLT